jgi:hypothetical protein
MPNLQSVLRNCFLLTIGTLGGGGGGKGGEGDTQVSVLQLQSSSIESCVNKTGV